MMLDGRFTWNTTSDLAKRWRCDPSTVRSYAAEALRAYRRELERSGGEEYRARLMAALEQVGRSALERTEEVVDVMGDVRRVHRPDHRTARQCLVDLAQLGGLLVHKHEVSVSELTDEELRAQLRAHGLEVRTIETTAEPAMLGKGEKSDERGSGDTSD
jgi:uroporphyrinogen-III synthase